MLQYILSLMQKRAQLQRAPPPAAQVGDGCARVAPADQVDISVFEKYEDSNNGYGYVLCIMDKFGKFKQN